MYRLLYDRRPAADQQWFDTLLPYNFELFTVLGAPHQLINRYQKQFQSKPFNPDLRPQHLAASKLHNAIDGLRQLQAEIEAKETNQAIRQAYSLKIDELVIQNQLLLASIGNDRQAFAECNAQLYGRPDNKLFAAACAWVRQQAANAISSPQTNTTLQQAALSVLQHIPDLHGSIEHIVPNDQLFKQLRAMHFAPGGYIDSLFGQDAIAEHITAANGDDITRAVIRRLESEYSLQDSTDELWGVVHSEQAVVRPVKLDVSRASFMGIVAHEIGSHLLERENGLRQPLRLLSIGLDRYESNNEGRAFLREQIMHHSPYDMLNQADWRHIIQLYIAAALGAGIHGKPYDFQSLHAVLYPVCLLFHCTEQPDSMAYAARRAADEAWHICVRIAKGTDGQGGAYLKALAYLDGNVACWRLAERNPELIFLGDAGKLNLCRNDHLDILRSLNIQSPLAH